MLRIALSEEGPLDALRRIQSRAVVVTKGDGWQEVLSHRSEYGVEGVCSTFVLHGNG